MEPRFSKSIPEKTQDILRSVRDEVARLRLDTATQVSHQLRSPLTAILGFAEMIFADESLAPEKKLEFASIVRNEVDRVLEFLINSHDAIQLHSHPHILHRTMCDYSTTVSAVIDSLKGLANSRSVRIERTTEDAPLVSFIDRVRMFQALRHLIQNAVLFTPVGGLVSVAITAQGSILRTSVSDTGTGIPVDELPNIFEPFFRGLRADQHHRSAGLGLTIAHKIIELHGGLLTVKSNVFAGTTCTVEIPRGLIDDTPDAFELLPYS